MNQATPFPVSGGLATSNRRAYLTCKRVLDVLLTVVVLILALPVMLLIAVLIAFDSPGPVLFRQERVGLDGRHFTFYKFRTMRSDADPEVHRRYVEALIRNEAPNNARQSGPKAPLLKMTRDPRITRVGRILRQSSLDELPQLINVLRGDMSLVGPRPERPHFVEQLAQLIPFYNERTYVKPGITGWAQVNYPYGASVEDARAKLSYDLYYVKNRTILLDLLILLSTVRVILFQEGAR